MASELTNEKRPQTEWGDSESRGGEGDTACHHQVPFMHSVGEETDTFLYLLNLFLLN